MWGILSKLYPRETKENGKVSPYIDKVFCYMFWSFGTVGLNTFIWEQGCAQPGARWRERCCICHYRSWTDSVNQSLLFQTLDAVFPKDLYLEYLAFHKENMARLSHMWPDEFGFGPIVRDGIYPPDHGIDNSKYLSQLMRFWHLLPSVNSIFKHACAAIHWGYMSDFGQTLRLLPYFMCGNS